MKVLIRLSVIMIVAFVSTLSSHGQCLQTQAQQFQCTGPNNCSQTVAINSVYPVEYGWYMTYFPVACCSTYINTNVPDTACDGDRAQIARGPLSEVAALQPLLIRDCSGGYNPYFDPLPANRDYDLKKLFNDPLRVALN